MANAKSGEILGEIIALQTKRGATCSVSMILSQLPAPDRSAVEQAFEDPMIFGTSIAKFLKTRGVDISSHTIQRHRRGSCGCD